MLTMNYNTKQSEKIQLWTGDLLITAGAFNLVSQSYSIYFVWNMVRFWSIDSYICLKRDAVMGIIAQPGQYLLRTETGGSQSTQIPMGGFV